MLIQTKQYLHLDGQKEVMIDRLRQTPADNQLMKTGIRT